ncbi:hypothetical protein HPB51_008651 [Rhipicephalus microplus]|uniref:Uncharacterized protein n=1 Tax=Rhipicephalus microplus TaxID=6941 RepID=A0A9J6EGA2_RHIMP|nr:hypothetical protein HPB51_008651 [Rhipicephalus microplus]
MVSNDSVSTAEGMDIDTGSEMLRMEEVVSTKKKLAEKAHCSQAALEQVDGCGGVRTAAQSRGGMRRVVKASRIPNLPRDHFNTIVHQRSGLDARKANLAKAASLMAEQTCEDTLCANPFQNIFIVATQLENNARAYA